MLNLKGQTTRFSITLLDTLNLIPVYLPLHLPISVCLPYTSFLTPFHYQCFFCVSLFCLILCLYLSLLCLSTNTLLCLFVNPSLMHLYTSTFTTLYISLLSLFSLSQTSLQLAPRDQNASSYLSSILYCLCMYLSVSQTSLCTHHLKPSQLSISPLPVSLPLSPATTYFSTKTRKLSMTALCSLV